MEVMWSPHLVSLSIAHIEYTGEGEPRINEQSVSDHSSSVTEIHLIESDLSLRGRGHDFVPRGKESIILRITR